jgi:hypothetical protein
MMKLTNADITLDATFSCLRYRRLTSICNAKRRMSDRVSPWNLLFLINSYLGVKRKTQSHAHATAAAHSQVNA